MRRIFFMLLLSLVSVQVLCVPKVIATLGPTVSIAPYLSAINTDKRKEQPKLPSHKRVSMNLAVHSKGLSPGIVIPKKIQAPLLAQPIYIVGNDKLSVSWLEKYAARLRSIHAVGFIVNVDSNLAYRALEMRINLTLIPMNGTALMRRFGLKHYPVLISKHRIEQ